MKSVERNMVMTGERLLKIYAGVLTAAGAAALLCAAAPKPKPTTFDEITVQRINVVEPDGTLRMVVSNRARLPGIVVKGVEHPHPVGRHEAGVIFYNDEGTENGGLVIGGSGKDDKVRSGGSLTFDQYEQDQVVQIMQNEDAGARWAGLVVSDRPVAPLDLKLMRDIVAMPDGPEKRKLLHDARVRGDFGRDRLFVGKTGERDAQMSLKDAQGRPRMVLKVAADGAASIDFLDETGKVVRRVTPTSTN
jgi:hypothetical protein